MSTTEQLNPGDEHYRAYVGRVEHYDLAAGLQFSLLFMLGLRESHKLLDIGCGSLRGGRLFVPYLKPGCYFGLEPNRWLVEQGIAEELGEDLARRKQPRFEHNDCFDLSGFQSEFDFVLAQSIFSHTGISQLRACLKSVANTLAPGGKLVATFVEWPTDHYEDRWVYPGLNHFTWDTVRRECNAVGLHSAKLDWPHTLQTWFIATRDQTLVEGGRVEGVDVLADSVSLTGDRFQGRKDGKVLRFLRHIRAG